MLTDLASPTHRIEQRGSLVWFRNGPKSISPPLAAASRNTNISFSSPPPRCSRQVSARQTLHLGARYRASGDNQLCGQQVSKVRLQVEPQPEKSIKRVSIVWFVGNQGAASTSTSPNHATIPPPFANVRRKPAVGFVENTDRYEKLPSREIARPPIRTIRRKPVVNFRPLATGGARPSAGGSGQPAHVADYVRDVVMDVPASDLRTVHRQDALAALEGRRYAISLPMGEDISFKDWVARAGAPLVNYYGMPRTSVSSASSSGYCSYSYSSSSAESSAPATPLTPSPAMVPIPLPPLESSYFHGNTLITHLIPNSPGVDSADDWSCYADNSHNAADDNNSSKYNSCEPKSKSVFKSLARKLKAPFKKIATRMR